MEEVELKYQMLMSSFLCLFLLFFSCQQPHEKREKSDEEVNTAEVFSNPDLVVNQLTLRDESTLKKFYPLNIDLKDGLRETPVAIFLDKEGEKYLIAYQYEGDMQYSFSCFEIGYLKDDANISNNAISTQHDDFITESGLKLGMSLQEITKMKGKNYKVEEASSGKIVQYRIDDLQSPILKKYEMPPYFLKFYLRNDKVYKILFGFEYP